METVVTAITTVLDRLVDVALMPFDPEQRIYFAYVASSVLIAWLIYRSIRNKRAAASDADVELAQGSFLSFLFPKKVWDHPSAWLDLRYMVFHKVVSYFLMIGLGGWALAVGFRAGSGGISITDALGKVSGMGISDALAAVLYMFVVLMFVDFIGWAIHYLQHRVPLLWQFHKVHHSAEVMHPISNFREHPIDNFAYGLFIGVGYGAAHGLAMRFFGFVPTMPTLLGIPLLMFLFNIVGYNLRHSHIWLRWPGVLSMIFPSPAHHHVHHSSHPDHLDKNFAFMFPIWDVIFRTYHMPEDNRDVRFGTVEDTSEMNTCLRLYWIPFRDAWRLFRSKGDKPEKPDASDRPAVTPAE
jgi:sterol desaturase/sphingolipid hydroxylase (fatty acid hydroxylase superfamily)